MSWAQIEPGLWSNDSGWLLEFIPGVGPYAYSEELEDEIPNTGLPLQDLFNNPFIPLVTVDPDTGKIPVSLMPPLAITDVYLVNTQGEMLALIAEKGDVAIRSDLPGAPSFILAGNDPTFLGNWKEITVRYISWDHIQNLPTAFPPTAHSHDSQYYTKLEIDLALSGKVSTGLISPLNILQDSNHRFVTDAQIILLNSAGSPDWTSIANKPLTFPPSNHNHDLDYYKKSETDSLLSGKRNIGNISANEVTEDSTHRFITDAERALWNAGGGPVSIPNPLNQDINFAVGKGIKVNNIPPAGFLDDGTPFYRRVFKITIPVSGSKLFSFNHNIPGNIVTNDRVLPATYIRLAGAGAQWRIDTASAFTVTSIEVFDTTCRITLAAAPTADRILRVVIEYI
ncbi:hypothetical protein [Leptospira stimsonii]|uniref:Phage tail protein n=1 Tax=Leptospira stimsonii TaxID=2202203 RepID=A0ABY2MV74_9LEPT|nr:hypothetical protein [Leptospira stimsonii]TGK25380.1 hypothetical protein EHO98_02990 [Leptospira stimsonii]TGM08799.1 hypothetical protein EHQ90_22175 [Leptospira stimsonii]